MADIRISKRDLDLFDKGVKSLASQAKTFAAEFTGIENAVGKAADAIDFAVKNANRILEALGSEARVPQQAIDVGTGIAAGIRGVASTAALAGTVGGPVAAAAVLLAGATAGAAVTVGEEDRKKVKQLLTARRQEKFEKRLSDEASQGRTIAFSRAVARTALLRRLRRVR